MMVLEGIRVIDLTQFISGSRCTQILADMGAEVVKVEPPQGDALRLIFSLIPGAERNYSVFNRNKYGMAVDWRGPGGRELIRRLAGSADIFVHNLIPGTLERWGLGYDELGKDRPDLIYLAISGFGATGVNPGRAAFDIIAQATAGQLWNDLEDLAPPSNYWGDLMSGAYAAIAALMAIIHRMKTGLGQNVDISMQDVLYFNNYRAMVDRAMGPVMSQVEQTLGREPRDVLNSADRMPFYGFFRTRGHKVAIVALTPRQWKDLAETVGNPGMATEPRFNNLLAQIRHHREAVEIIEAWTSNRDAAEVMAALEARKIPCGQAYSIEEVNRDANLGLRGMFSRVHHGVFGGIDVPGIPYHFGLSPGSVRFPAPGLGEHTELILREWLAYADDEIEGLRRAGVIH
jgi:crotonobetainyl-CoA:carnitine CoA-transferase CaiB-like acyl-CoA transferase